MAKFKMIDAIKTKQSFRLNETSKYGSIRLGVTKDILPGEGIETDDPVLIESVRDKTINAVWSQALEDTLIKHNVPYEVRKAACNCSNSKRLVYKPFEEIFDE